MGVARAHCRFVFLGEAEVHEWEDVLGEVAETPLQFTIVFDIDGKGGEGIEATGVDLC